MPDYQYVLYEVEGEVARITMNRPDQRNAINRELAEELLDAFTRVNGESGVKVVLLSGAGKSFCAGGDLSVLPTFDHYSVIDWMGRTGLGVIRAITENDKVVVAKIKGHCIAGGLELALACDLAYASERTKLGVTEVSMGIIPGWGGTVRLARCLPLQRGKEIVLTGKRDYTADEFYEMGLLTRVYREEEFDAKVDEMISLLCANPADSMRAAKMVMNRTFNGLSLDDAMALERMAMSWLFHNEQVTAVREAAIQAFEAAKKEQGEP
jgi:enoyl-CoA hydratase/carnithine racemase